MGISVSVLNGQRQENLCNFEDRLGYMANSRIAKSTQRDPAAKREKKKNRTRRRKKK